MPSFIDTHAHFREPGFTQKEDIESGSKAAAKGGYTGVCLMANTWPVCSNYEVLNHVRNRAKEVGLTDIQQCVSITENFKGSNIEHLNMFKDDKEVKAISDDGIGVMDSSIMMKAMEVAREYLNVIQKAYRKGIDKTVAISMTKGTAIAYDEQADDFYIDELVLRNQIYLAFNAQVMKNNNVLKKLLQESSAINLNVTISEDVFTVNSNEIVKQQAELKKQREELAKRVLLDIDQIADKKTLQEVLTNTCNRSHPEMAEYVELAEKYQELVPKSFKADLKEIMARENIDAYEAYKIARESATKKKKEYKEKDAQEAVIEVNKLIKAEGIKYCIDLFEPFNIYRSTEYNEIFPRVTLIRTELEGEEGFKRTRLSQKKMNALAQILVEKRYYGIKPPPKLGSKTLRKQVENKIQKEREKAEKKNQRLISSGKKTLKIKVVDVDKFEIEYLQKLHKKNLDKALEQLYQDIKKIYNFTEDTKTLMISSIKFKTSKTLN